MLPSGPKAGPSKGLALRPYPMLQLEAGVHRVWLWWALCWALCVPWPHGPKSLPVPAAEQKPQSPCQSHCV